MFRRVFERKEERNRDSSVMNSRTGSSQPGYSTLVTATALLVVSTRLAHNCLPAVLKQLLASSCSLILSLFKLTTGAVSFISLLCLAAAQFIVTSEIGHRPCTSTQLLLCQVPLAPCTSTELTHAISCHRSSPRTAVFLVGDCSTAAYSSAMVSSLRWITPAPVTCF